MKKIIFLLMILTSAIEGYSQAKIEIKFDFKKKEFLNSEQLEKIQRGDYYKLTIENINLNLFDITVNKTDSITDRAIPMPSIPLLGGEGFSALLSACTAIGGVISATSMESDQFAIIQTDQVNAGSKKDKSLKNQILLTAIEKTNSREKQFLKYIKDFNDGNAKNTQEILTESDGIDAFLYDKAKILIAAQFESTSCDPALGSKDPCVILAEDLKKVDGFQKTLKAKLNNVKKEFATYSQNTIQFQDLLKTNDQIRAVDSSARKVYHELVSALDSLNMKISLSQTDSLFRSLIAVYNNFSYKYQSFPMQFTKDKSSLTINITPRKTAPYLQSYSTTLEFPLKSKWFYGVSSGFYGSWLHDDAYSVSSYIPSSDTVAWYKVVQEDPGSIEVGISAMVHGGYKIWDPYVSVQIGFGPAISITKTVRPRLMMGGGLAIGNKHKVLVTGGLITGYVDRLSSVYDLSTAYKSAPSNVTVSSLEWNGFISIAYLFNL